RPLHSHHTSTLHVSHTNHTILPPFLIFLPTLPPPTSTLFPYTTLFRSPVSLDNRIRARSSDRKKSATRRQPPHFLFLQNTERQPDRKSTRLELQSRFDLVCRLLLEKKKKKETNLQIPHIHNITKRDSLN